MRRMRWATYLWPGAPQLWVYGSWPALALALLFTVLLNVALLGSFGWSELVGEEVRTALWLALGVIWVGSGGFSIALSRRQEDKQIDEAAAGFDVALDHYLKGNWVQAERELGLLLRNNARDLEARLMWATLLRHTGRLAEAEEQLELLTRLEGAEKWALEIQGERELLAEAGRTAQTGIAETAALGPAEPSGAATRAA